MWLESTDQQGLEGIVSKRLASRYDFGARSPHWLKFPHRRRTSWVIGGWRPETGSDHRVGSVLVGEPTSQGLVFRGRVGSGIAGKVGPVLKAMLEPLERKDSPFLEVPRIDAAGPRGVGPLPVVDVAAPGPGGKGRPPHPRT